MVDEGGSGSSSLMSTIFSGDKNRSRSEQLIPIIKIHWDDVEDPLIVAICIGFGIKLTDVSSLIMQNRLKNTIKYRKLRGLVGRV